MKIYRMKRLKLNPFPLIGIILLILCFVPYIFIPGLMPENRLEDNTLWIRIALILLSGILFFASLFSFAATRTFTTGERKEAFAETDDGKLLYLFVVPEEPVMARSTVGKLASIPKNIEIDERNKELIALMDLPRLSEDLKAYFNEDLNADSPFINKLHIHVMENPRIMKVGFFGNEIRYTMGKHQKIYSVTLDRRNEGFKRICRIIDDTPCRVNYKGKNVGDFFID